MVISSRVQSQLFRPQPSAQAASQAKSSVIRLPPKGSEDTASRTKRLGTPWSEDEHDRFLRGLELFPRGPWKDVAEFVGTRTARQTMTHAQKYRQKIERCKFERSITDAKQPQSPRPAKHIAPASPALVNDLECIDRHFPNREPSDTHAHGIIWSEPANAAALEESTLYDEDFWIDEEVLASIVDALPTIDIITDRPFAHAGLCVNAWEDSMMWIAMNNSCL